VLFLGGLYLVAGLVSAALAKSAASDQIRVVWRLAAWVISAVGFATHILYEQIRLRSSPATTALHVALAVALGAFGLAVAARLHSQNFPAFALVLWPVATALPAFVVALAVAAVLSRTRRESQPDSPL
jgi:TRAP-type C4-dicarboxylate transport system permease small subunit